MTAQEILKMIESVDPADTAKLDEIDARVCDYIINDLSSPWPGRMFRYTRDRNALKQIRPEGWDWIIKSRPDGGCECQGGDVTRAIFLPTEELAELHAIIQAIEYERSKND